MEFTVYEEINRSIIIPLAAAPKALMANAMTTLMLILTIDFALGMIFNIDNPDNMKIFVQKMLKAGFWVFIVQNFVTLADPVSGIIPLSMTEAANTIGGTNISAIMNDPFSLLKATTDYCVKYEEMTVTSLINITTGFDFNAINRAIQFPFIFLIITIITALLSAIIFIAKIEFYMVTAIALVLLPFGALKYTAFLGEKAIGAIWGCAVKYCVTGVIASMFMTYIQKFTLPASTSDAHQLSMLWNVTGMLIVFALMILVIPNFVTSLLSGSPSLSGGAVMGAGSSVSGSVQSFGKHTGMTRETNTVTTGSKGGTAAAVKNSAAKAATKL
ncbi:MAG: type IV secretion system protein [Patescibacteria group bacterium]|jgi:type IV secretion system protein TrbL